MAVKTNQTWTLYNTNGSQDESNMNCLQNSSCLIRLDSHFFCREFMFDSSSRRIKHELSTKEMTVKTSKTWTLYNTNGSQEESNMNSLRVHVWFVLTAISFVESSCLIRLNNHLLCRDFMFYSSWSNMNSLQNKWLSRRIKHELSTKQMVGKTNQTWTLYKTNGSQEESTVISFVESSCFIRLDCHLFCREFIFDSPWLPFVGGQDESNMNSLQNKWQSRGIKHELSTKHHHLFCREFMFDSSWQPFVL
jgi:hypothetical protein